MSDVSVLFARRDSIYKKLCEDVWDFDRDATKYQGETRVVAHPQCRAWGRLRQFSKPARGEKELALFAVEVIRKNGGVLEHPAFSSLWPAAGLPNPGEIDEWGGFTLSVDQYWWGHRCQKKTYLYICGIRPAEMPAMPFKMGEATHVVSTSKRGVGFQRPEVSKAEREATPLEFAEWLLLLAQNCKKPKRTKSVAPRHM